MDGAVEMAKRLRGLGRNYTPRVVAPAMFQEMNIEATEMKRRTPVDTRPNAPHPGNLRASIHVEEPEIHGRTVTVIVATGAQAPYAIFVHENPDAFHPIGEWKFMESVLKESAPHMNRRIANRIHFDRMDLNVSR